jgi:hypothetical protein
MSPSQKILVVRRQDLKRDIDLKHCQFATGSVADLDSKLNECAMQ